MAGPGPHSKGLCQAPTAVGSSPSLSHFPTPLKAIPGLTSKQTTCIRILVLAGLLGRQMQTFGRESSNVTELLP